MEKNKSRNAKHEIRRESLPSATPNTVACTAHRKWNKWFSVWNFFFSNEMKKTAKNESNGVDLFRNNSLKINMGKHYARKSNKEKKKKVIRITVYAMKKTVEWNQKNIF